MSCIFKQNRFTIVPRFPFSDYLSSSEGDYDTWDIISRLNPALTSSQYGIPAMFHCFCEAACSPRFSDKERPIDQLYPYCDFLTL